jgi:hypothetical protein
VNPREGDCVVDDFSILMSNAHSASYAALISDYGTVNYAERTATDTIPASRNSTTILPRGDKHSITVLRCTDDIPNGRSEGTSRVSATAAEVKNIRISNKYFMISIHSVLIPNVTVHTVKSNLIC